ncbi:hypothetical protein DYB38_011705 [Aphanomyces astaci]|uniref:Uncharacterized protein n=1 Tax=Aphanomyces astaci TaxID=112090 RepID=A0A397EFJ0_APHAT|nr:hypothetical protein DYB38_011705 [Aphanomyces astaci]
MVKRVKDADGNAVQDIDWLNLKLYTKIPGEVRVETATDVRISMRNIIRDSYAAVYAYIPPNMCNTVPTVYGSEFIWGHAADSVLEFTILYKGFITRVKDTPVSRLLGICDDMVVETINDVPYPEYLEVLKAWTGQPGQRTSDWMKKPSHVEAWTFKVHEYDCAAYAAISAGAHAHVHNDVVLELEDAIAKVKGTLQSNDEEIVR